MLVPPIATGISPLISPSMRESLRRTGGFSTTLLIAWLNIRHQEDLGWWILDLWFIYRLAHCRSPWFHVTFRWIESYHLPDWYQQESLTKGGYVGAATLAARQMWRLSGDWKSMGPRGVGGMCQGSLQESVGPQMDRSFVLPTIQFLGHPILSLYIYISLVYH